MNKFIWVAFWGLWTSSIALADVVQDFPIDRIEGATTQKLPVDGIWHRGQIYDAPAYAAGIAIGTELVRVDDNLAVIKKPGGLLAINAKVSTRPGLTARLPSTDWRDHDLTAHPLAVWLKEPACQIGVEFWAEEPEQEIQKGISVTFRLLGDDGIILGEREYDHFVGMTRVGFDVTESGTDIKAIQLVPRANTGIAIISVRARTCSLLLG